MVAGLERLPHGEQRVRADVAVDDTQRSDGQHEIAVRPLTLRAVRIHDRPASRGVIDSSATPCAKEAKVIASIGPRVVQFG
jgi:hypothetical protein